MSKNNYPLWLIKGLLKCFLWARVCLLAYHLRHFLFSYKLIFQQTHTVEAFIINSLFRPNRLQSIHWGWFRFAWWLFQTLHIIPNRLKLLTGKSRSFFFTAHFDRATFINLKALKASFKRFLFLQNHKVISVKIIALIFFYLNLWWPYLFIHHGRVNGAGFWMESDLHNTWSRSPVSKL